MGRDPRQGGDGFYQALSKAAPFFASPIEVLHAEVIYQVVRFQLNR